ncbi:IscS subfamily cysteine desulfurase [Bacillus sp. 03113]|uniref:IscS subfamily cysteine desulfurase n=1 Tax=Bacillus sp. 03113 TaxID=2578211 RepID=UPI0011450A22|nr:IscS subfamily cysteine desulfurase [Bacillus sp. 03113]
MIYFDYAATCPIDREAGEALIKASQEYYGNSNSLHNIGSKASQLLENCREAMSSFLHVKSDGIYFTSGGSESNFLAIHSLLTAAKKAGKHIITGMAEHSSIHSTMKILESNGYSVTYLPFNDNGLIDISKLKQAIREDTIMLSIQHGNSEIGSIQPLEEIGIICKEKQILFHSDCVHTFGKIQYHEVANYVHAMSVSGHKFYGPKGIGAVYIDPALGWKAFFPESSHEKGFRPGTVNVPAIASMITAAQKIQSCIGKNENTYHLLREAFINSLTPIKEDIVIYDARNKQMPSTVGLRIRGMEGQWIMLECNRLGYAISTGSACQVGLQSPSKTMKALGLPDDQAKEFIRISFGQETALEHVKQLGKTIVSIVQD